MRRIAYASLVVIGGITAFTLYRQTIESCDGPRTPLVAVRSPDGKWLAEQVLEQCGKWPTERNVYISSQDRTFRVLRSYAATEEIIVTWTSATDLRVIYPASIHASQEMWVGPGSPEAMGIKVNYEEVDL